MSKVICEREDIVAIADAVRSKTGTTDEMTLGGIASGIEGIETGGGSGGGVETCTVTVQMDGSWVQKFIYTILTNDGQIETIYETDRYSPFTVENVVCGTFVVLEAMNGDMDASITAENVTEILSIIYQGSPFAFFIMPSTNDDVVITCGCA